MVHIDRLLGRVKDELRTLLEPSTILGQCRAVGHRWRSGPLDPATLVQLFVLQILHGNIACSALRHHSDRPFSVSAYCQARRRLPLAVIEALARRVARVMEKVCDQQGLWHGHRLWRVDGTGVSMPDTPELRDHFGQPKKQPTGCGFPVASLVVRVHAGTGMLLDMIIGPLVRHEMACAAQLHPKMRAGDVLVGDRGYCSYAHLALLLQGKMHAVLRLHQRIKTSFQPGRPCALDLPQKQRRGVPNSRVVRRHGREDQVVTYYKRSSMKPRWMSREAFDALPEEIEVRELRYRIRRRGFRTRTVILVTTLTERRGGPGRGTARGLRRSLADRGRSAKPEDLAGHGRAALQERRGRDEGAVDVRAGLQPRAAGDAGGGSPTESAGRPHQLRRRLAPSALARPRRAADGPAG